jgi:hypothetical protein
MSTVIIISIVLFLLLLIGGVGAYFYTKKTSDSNEETPETKTEVEPPSSNPSSAISEDMTIGGSATWNSEGDLICGMTSQPKQGNNLFCTDYSKENKFISMNKDCIDIDVDQQNKRIFCINRKDKKVNFVTIKDGLETDGNNLTWSNIPGSGGPSQFTKISVNGTNIVGLGNDKNVYKYNSTTGWQKQGNLVAQEIAALSYSTDVGTNVGYIIAANATETNDAGFRLYGYGIQGAPAWYAASYWSGTKVDAGNTTNINQPVVCHINKANSVYCQTTLKPIEQIKLPSTDNIWNNINVKGEGNLFLTDRNNKVFYTDLNAPKSGEFYNQIALSGLLFSKIAS